MRAVSFVRTAPHALGERERESGYTNPLSLDELVVVHPTSTFFMRVGEEVEDPQGLGVSPNDLLVVDRALPLSVERLVVVVLNRSLVLRRYTQRCGMVTVGDASYVSVLEDNGEVLIWGVVST